MEGGPPRFRPDFTCPALLRCLSRINDSISHTGLSPCIAEVSTSFCYRSLYFMKGPTTPKIKSSVWALPFSLAATQGISYRFLLLRLLRCVSSAGVASSVLFIQTGIVRYNSYWVAPFGNLRFIAFYPAPRSLSQVSRPSSPFDAKASVSSP